MLKGFKKKVKLLLHFASQTNTIAVNTLAYHGLGSRSPWAKGGQPPVLRVAPELRMAFTW